MTTANREAFPWLLRNGWLVIFGVSSLVRADDARLIGVLRDALAARKEQLSTCQFSLKRVFGPQPGLHGFDQANYEFRKAAVAAAGVPIRLERPDPSTRPLLERTAYWRGVISGQQHLYYFGQQEMPSLSAGWSYRELFTGKHFERYAKESSTGPHVTLSSSTRSPPLLSIFGLELPLGVTDTSWPTTSFLDRLGTDWQIDTLELVQQESDERRLELTASLLKDPSDGLARRLIGDWDMARGAVPLSMTFEWAVAENGKVAPLRATRGTFVNWTRYRTSETGLRVPQRMVCEDFFDAHLVGDTGSVHLLRKDGELVKGPDGYPVPDIDRHAVQRFITARDEWELEELALDRTQDESLFSTEYEPGTVVQNELGAEIEVYQLLGTSPAVTATMRRMLEALESPEPTGVNRNSLIRLLLANVALLATIIVAVAFVRRWRRRMRSTGAGEKKSSG